MISVEELESIKKALGRNLSRGELSGSYDRTGKRQNTEDDTAPRQEQLKKKLKKLKKDREKNILQQIKDANDDAHYEEEHRYDDINNAMDAYLRHVMNFLGWQESEAYAIAWLVLCEVSGCYFPVTKCTIMKGVYRAFRLLVRFPSETTQLSSVWIFYWLKFMALTRDSFLIYEATKAFKQIINEAYEEKAAWLIEFTRNDTITIDTDIRFLEIAEEALCAVLKYEKIPCVAQRINRETEDIYGRIVAKIYDYSITGGTRAEAGVKHALDALELFASKVKKQKVNKNDSLLQNEFSKYTKLETVEKLGAAIKKIVPDDYRPGHCARTLFTAFKVAKNEYKDILKNYAPEFEVFCKETYGVGSACLMEMTKSLDEKYEALGVPRPDDNSAATLIARLKTCSEMLLPAAVAKKYHDENRKRTVDGLASLTCMCLRGKTPGKTPDKEDVLALYKKLFDRNFEDDTYGWRRKYLSKVLATDTEEQEYILNYLSNESRSFGCVLGVPASSSCYQTLPILPQTPNFAETLRSAQQYLGLSPLQQFLNLPQSFEQLYAMPIINTAVVRGMPKQKEPKSLRDVPALIQKKEISLPERCVYLVHVRTAEEQAIAERRVVPSKENIKKHASMVDTIGTFQNFTPVQMQQDSSLLAIRAIRLAIRTKKQEQRAKRRRIRNEIQRLRKDSS